MTALVEFVDEHRGPVEYDWRTRFHLGVDDIGGRMTWGEARRLLKILAGDPSSQLAAALAEWAYPMSREALILADLFDLQHISKSKRKPDSYPRPWPDGSKKVTKVGDASHLTPVQVADILRDHGHHIEGATERTA